MGCPRAQWLALFHAATDRIANRANRADRATCAYRLALQVDELVEGDLVVITGTQMHTCRVHRHLRVPFRHRLFVALQRSTLAA